MSGDIDERLAAWLDGAMSADEASAFETAMAADPALAERAASWRANDAFIAHALASEAAPVEPELLARMGLAPRIAANDNLPWWRRHALPLGGAIAASLAVALMLGRPGAPVQDPLSVALDSTPSLTSARLADGRTIEPTLTVRAKDGRWCREFRSQGAVNLACRNDGEWHVEGTVNGQEPASGEAFSLANGASNAALDTAYERIGASDPISAEREAQLLAGKWVGN